METILINEKTTPFYMARWLLLKKKITQKELFEYSQKSRDELLRIINDFGYIVKITGKKELIYETSDAELFE